MDRFRTTRTGFLRDVLGLDCSVIVVFEECQCLYAVLLGCCWCSRVRIRCKVVTTPAVGQLSFLRTATATNIVQVQLHLPALRLPAVRARLRSWAVEVLLLHLTA